MTKNGRKTCSLSCGLSRSVLGHLPLGGFTRFKEFMCVYTYIDAYRAFFHTLKGIK